MALKRHGRKLLVASIGVAAVSYAACDDAGTVANLMAPPTTTTGSGGSGGAPSDANADSNPKDGNPPINWDVVANLMPPPHD